MSSETQFEQLSGLPGHISSFAAATSDGQLLHSTKEDSEAGARSSFHLLKDATRLAHALPDLANEKLRTATVTFPDTYHTLTVSGNAIFGVERQGADK